MEKTGSGIEVSSTELGASHWYEKFIRYPDLTRQVLASKQALENDYLVPSLYTLSKRKMLSSEIHDYKQVFCDDLFPGSIHRFSGLDYLITSTNYHDRERTRMAISPPDPFRAIMREYSPSYHLNGKPCDVFSAFAEERNHLVEPLAYEFQLARDEKSHVVFKNFKAGNFLALVSAMDPADVVQDSLRHGHLLPMPHHISLTSDRVLGLFQEEFETYLRTDCIPSVDLNPVVSFRYDFKATSLSMTTKEEDLTFSYCATTFSPFEVSRCGGDFVGFKYDKLLNYLYAHNYEADFVKSENHCLRRIPGALLRGSCVAHTTRDGVDYCLEMYTHDVAIPTVFSIFVDGKVWYPLGIFVNFLDLGLMSAMDKRTLKGLLGKEQLKKFRRRWYSKAENYNVIAESVDL